MARLYRFESYLHILKPALLSPDKELIFAYRLVGAARIKTLFACCVELGALNLLVQRLAILRGILGNDLTVEKLFSSVLMASYEDVLEAAVGKEASILGDGPAIRTAQKVENLDIDDHGNVKGFEGNGAKVLEELVEKYIEIGGEVTATLIARKLDDEGLKDVELPETLKDRL